MPFRPITGGTAADGLRHLATALDGRCHTGAAPTGPPVVVITGAVGTGKTHLLHAFLPHVADSGARLLAATASRAEQDVPFGIVRQLLDAAGASVPPADPPDRGRHEPARHPDEEIACWGEALGRALGTSPAVVVVDDIHLADSASLRCLAALSDQITPLPMLMVLAKAPQAAPRHFAARALLLPRPGLLRLHLSLLGAAEVRAMTARRLGPAAAEALTSDLHAMSGGNPLLVRALLDDQRGCGATDVALAGDAFREAILTCLHRCEPVVLTTLRALAVTGDRIGGPLLRDLVDLDGAAGEVRLTEETTAGLVRDDRVAHHAVAHAIHDAMSLAERVRLHHAVARRLYLDGEPHTTVAPHLLETGDTAEPWMIRAMVSASEQLIRESRSELALRYLRWANRRCSDVTEQARVQAALAQAEWGRDPQAAVRHLPAVVRAVRDGHLGLSGTVSALRGLLWHGQADTAVHLIHHERRRRARDTSATVELGTYLEFLWMLYPMSAPRPESGCTTPGNASSIGNDVWHLEQGLSTLSSVLHRGAHHRSLRDAERILRAVGTDERDLWCAVWALAALIYADWLEAATTWCRLVADQAERNGNFTALAVVNALMAEVSVRRGDPAAAEGLGERAFTHLGPRSWGVAIGYPLAIRVRALTLMGRFDEAAEQLRTPVPPAMFDTPFGLFYLHARGEYALTDDAEAALRDFETCGRLMAAWQLDLPVLLPWRTNAARACLRLGRTDDARRLALEDLSALPTTASRLRGKALRVLSATAGAGKRVRLLRQAVDALADGGDVVEQAQALFDLGGAYQAVRRTHDARRAIRAANALIRDLPAAIPLGRSESQPAGTDEAAVVQGLSPAESRVATLAAQGHTNREIAATLFLTVSTVEQHLTKAYRKLQVDNRGELALRLRAQSAAESTPSSPVGESSVRQWSGVTGD
ncbi:AAA family ATPase [Micromonospora sp. NPDC051196]|uniref:AAA family ATPase n=1 Tax=Micromonospora sp. NPDC051196 TaxID=3155281 RepID=UPI00343C18D7